MYVNAYVLAVPHDKKEEYTEKARLFAEIAKDYGAIEIFENWEVEVPDGDTTDYRRAVRAGTDEAIVVSWTIWPDRMTGAIAHKSMFEDARITEIGEFPIDGSRMILGGFEPVYAYHKIAETH